MLYNVLIYSIIGYIKRQQMHIMQLHEQFSKILEICKSFMPGMFNKDDKRYSNVGEKLFFFDW